MPTPDFILRLRDKIGNDPLWLPGTTALVRDAAGRVLLGQRADNGHWCLVSGIPEPGEEMAAAIAREVLEETRVVVEVSELIAVRTVGPVTYPNGDVTTYVDHFFRCTATGGEVGVGDEESLAVGWFEPDELPEPLGAGTLDLLELAAEQERTGRTWFTR